MEKDVKNKILITGTGRSGTSFLIQLMSFLDMDTGYDKDVTYEQHPPHNIRNINAGLETQPLSNKKVRIHKAPGFALEIDSIIKNHKLDHVIVPIRNLQDSANSRVKAGLLWGGSNDLQSQINYNSKLLYNLTHSLVRDDIPHTFIPFPEFIYDENIIYDKLEWLFKEYSISKEEYLSVFNKLSDTDKISFKK
jgi:hypothetical protein